MKNIDIREKARADGVKLWQIANRLGMNDGNFSRLLRNELQQEVKDRIIGIIDEIAAEQEVS